MRYIKINVIHSDSYCKEYYLPVGGFILLRIGELGRAIELGSDRYYDIDLYQYERLLNYLSIFDANLKIEDE